MYYNNNTKGFLALKRAMNIQRGTSYFNQAKLMHAKLGAQCIGLTSIKLLKTIMIAHLNPYEQQSLTCPSGQYGWKCLLTQVIGNSNSISRLLSAAVSNRKLNGKKIETRIPRNMHFNLCFCIK